MYREYSLGNGTNEGIIEGILESGKDEYGGRVDKNSTSAHNSISKRPKKSPSFYFVSIPAF